MCHGMMEHQDTCCFPGLSASFATRNFGTYRFDLPLYSSISNIAYRFCNYWWDVWDLLHVALKLHEQHGLRVIGLCGHSRGATIVALVTALIASLALGKDLSNQPHRLWQDLFMSLPNFVEANLMTDIRNLQKRIVASSLPHTLAYMISLAARFDMNGLLERFSQEDRVRLVKEPMYKVPWTIQFGKNHPLAGKEITIPFTAKHFSECANLPLREAYAWIPNHIYALIIHGLHDTRIPFHDAISICNSLVSCRIRCLHLLPNCDHFMRTRNDDLHDNCATAIDYIVTWMQNVSSEPLLLLGDPDRVYVTRLQGLSNFRNVYDRYGKVKKKLLYRCAFFSKLSFADEELIIRHGIKDVFDLRSENECKSRGWIAVDGIVTHHVSLKTGSIVENTPNALGERWSRYTREPQGFVDAYMEMLRHGKETFSQIIRYVIETKGRVPFMIHCTAGKDRTGVTVMLLLALAGVDDDTICSDYAFTAHLLPPPSRRTLKNFHDLTGGAIPVENLHLIWRCPIEAMRSLLNLIRKEWGSVDQYAVQELQISDAELDAFRLSLKNEETRC